MGSDRERVWDGLFGVWWVTARIVQILFVVGGLFVDGGDEFVIFKENFDIQEGSGRIGDGRGERN